MTNHQGRRVGRLVVREVVGKTHEGRVLWLCLCDCGGSKGVASRELTKGVVRSCGCLRRESSLVKLTLANARRVRSDRCAAKRGAA